MNNSENKKSDNNKNQYKEKSLKSKQEKSKVVENLIQKVEEFAPNKGEKIIPKKFESSEILSEELKTLSENSIITSNKFSDQPLSTETINGLNANSFKYLTEIQATTLPHALVKRDILGGAVTGSGKTLAYVIPLLESLQRQKWSKLDKTGAIILVPTKELAAQVFTLLQKVGRFHDFSCTLLSGGKSSAEEFHQLEFSNIIIATPGRLLQHLDNSNTFEISNLQVLVLDEVDQLIEMGFMGQVQQIISALENTPKQTLMFSATLTASKVVSLQKLALKEPEVVELHKTAHLHLMPTLLKQQYAIVDFQDKYNYLYSFICSHLKHKTIVFMATVKGVRFMQETLRRVGLGMKIFELTSKKAHTTRTAVSMHFGKVETTSALLITTDVASRGLDFKGVDWVIHQDLAESLECQIHRTGRTARFCAYGNSLMLLSNHEKKYMNWLLANNIPVDELQIARKKIFSIHHKLQAIVFKNKDVKDMLAKYISNTIKFQMKFKSVLVTPDKNDMRNQMLNVGMADGSFDIEEFFSEANTLESEIDRKLKNMDYSDTQSGTKLSKLQKLKLKIQVKKGLNSNPIFQSNDQDDSNDNDMIGEGNQVNIKEVKNTNQSKENNLIKKPYDQSENKKESNENIKRKRIATGDDSKNTNKSKYPNNKNSDRGTNKFNYDKQRENESKIKFNNEGIKDSKIKFNNEGIKDSKIKFNNEGIKDSKIKFNEEKEKKTYNKNDSKSNFKDRKMDYRKDNNYVKHKKKHPNNRALKREMAANNNTDLVKENNKEINNKIGREYKKDNSNQNENKREYKNDNKFRQEKTSKAKDNNKINSIQNNQKNTNRNDENILNSLPKDLINSLI